MNTATLDMIMSDIDLKDIARKLTEEDISNIAKRLVQLEKTEEDVWEEYRVVAHHKFVCKNRTIYRLTIMIDEEYYEDVDVDVSEYHTAVAKKKYGMSVESHSCEYYNLKALLNMVKEINAEISDANADKKVTIALLCVSAAAIAFFITFLLNL